VLAVGLDAALDEFAVLSDDADLAGDFPQIETDEVRAGICSRPAKRVGRSGVNLF
jgi:hypothetical protein